MILILLPNFSKFKLSSLNLELGLRSVLLWGGILFPNLDFPKSIFYLYLNKLLLFGSELSFDRSTFKSVINDIPELLSSFISLNNIKYLAQQSFHFFGKTNFLFYRLLSLFLKPKDLLECQLTLVHFKKINDFLIPQHFLGLTALLENASVD